MMVSRHYLGITDYVVIALTLLISAVIGILFRYYGGGQKTIMEYFLAGRNMPKFPVVLSITVTMTSANTMLSSPSEAYRYGTQYTMNGFGMSLGMILASYVFVPVYFQCSVSTIYEYLEMRFGKLTRYTISAAYIIQSVLYMSAVLFAAVLALSAVTNISFEMSVISLGLCCAFYCSVGGLKAVLWTDVLQAFLMLSYVITVYVIGIGDSGGITNIFNISKTGQRLEFFNFSLDLTRRYTFWNCFLRGFWAGIAYYGAGQAEVQRMMTMSTCDRAKSVLRLSVFPVMFFNILCVIMGLILYSIYHACDPLLNSSHTGLTKYDQMVPYYIVTRVGSIPGLTGLCIAGIFSGSLSTISSSLNSLATVTVMDFLKPIKPDYFNDKRSLWVAKFLTTLYGIICIVCTLMFSSIQSVKQVSTTLLSLLEGPIVAIFSIAVLTRKANDKCILFGFLAALPIVGWIAFGTLLGKYMEPPLPLYTTDCSADISSFNMTISALQGNSSFATINSPKDVDNLLIIYKLSYMWLPILGTLLTLTFTMLAVIVTGWSINVIPEDSKCLSPVTRLWTRRNSLKSTNIEISDNGQLPQGLRTENGNVVAEKQM